MTVKLKEPRPLVVSIDWDYFLPRALEDFGFEYFTRDPDPYAVLQWQGRAFKCPIGEGVVDNSAYKSLRVCPARLKPFLSKVLADGNYFHLRVCESHHEIVEFTKELDSFDVVNFDAHHDVQYSLYETWLNCGNWAGHLRESGRLNSYTLVYPRWRHQCPEREDGTLPIRIDRVVYGSLPSAPLNPIKVFVCRSSPWTPSWCDAQWLQLIDHLRERPMLSTSLDANVMEPRAFDLESACEQELAASRIASLRQLNPDQNIPSLFDLYNMASNLRQIMNEPSKATEARDMVSGLKQNLCDYAYWEDAYFF